MHRFDRRCHHVLHGQQPGRRASRDDRGDSCRLRPAQRERPCPSHLRPERSAGPATAGPTSRHAARPRRTRARPVPAAARGGERRPVGRRPPGARLVARPRPAHSARRRRCHGVQSVAAPRRELRARHPARKGRLAQITALREDGSRQPYTYPRGGRGDDRYFQLPYAYWTDEHAWHTNLSFPAKVMLLIALSLTPPFLLPTEKAPRWYGISTDSAERGLRELRKASLLQRGSGREDELAHRRRLRRPVPLPAPSDVRTPRRQRDHLSVVGKAAS